MSFWDGPIPFFTPKDISQSHYVISTEKNISELGLNNCSSKLYLKNTTFVTARGTVGAIGLSGVKMAMNQSCYAILDNEKGKFFTHQHTLEAIKQLKREAVGAVFSALVTKDFDSCYVLDPGENVLKKFDIIAKHLYKCLEANTKLTLELNKAINLFLSKMTKIEVKKEIIN